MSDSVVEEPVTEEVKPKRTYRRRTTKKSESATTETPQTAGVSEDSESQEEPKKKRATRSRKTSSKKAEEKSESASNNSAAETSDQAKTSSASKVIENPEQSTEQSDTDEKPVRRRRVSRKKASEEVASDSSVQAVEGSAEKDEANHAVKEAEAVADAGSGASQEGSAESEKPSDKASEDAHDAEISDGESHEGDDKREDRYQGRGGSRKQRSYTKNNNHQKNSSQQKGGHFRSRRTHQQNRREPVVPQTSKEELAKLKVAELRARAEELEVDHKGLKKAELVEAVFAASIKAEGFMETAGILDVLSDGYGFLRTHGYLPSEEDVYVGMATIRRNGLRKGDYITGQTRPARPNEKYAALQRVDTVNGIALEDLGRRVRFADLTPVFPDERLVLEHGKSTITARVIDLCAPIGKGQRGLIVSPPKAGKTTILKDIAASIAANNPEVHLMCLLVDERPEEVTDMERSIHGEVISSTFDMPSENHIAVSELVIERAKRLVENGQDVVILLDSLTRLARAYNLAQPASGRILSGGVDSTALYPPKKFLGAARNIEGGGSLTILASALIETGSKMDEVIFEEFKGTGNMEVKLDRQLADRRIFPAIDPVASGTRREDLLLDPQEAPLIWAVRRILANRNNTERAMESLVKSLQQTNNNQEFLIRAAKKAQGHHFEEGNIEF
ncbi:MAG: transcription termination factor Rho [Eggerthellaceae bacterium]|nr:transcription termination factor Rho [Eggerthellaceae bacterium]